MVDNFINKEEQDEVCISICMENILVNIENGDIIDNG